MNMKLFKHWLMICLLVPLLAACSSEDSIEGIFINKVWRLSTIMEGSKNGSIYASDSEEQKTISESEAGCFTISFLPNTFSVRTLKNSYNGTWEVDGKKQSISFSFTNLTTDPSDVVSKRMINIMKNAVKYSGDSNTLTIQPQSGAYLLLYPLN
jgi:hypothetical protein